MTHTCKTYLLLLLETGTNGRAWVEHSSCEDDRWNYCEILKLIKT